MTIAIILLVLGWVEIRFSPRLEYLKKSSVLLFFFTAKKGIRKMTLINLNNLF